MQDALNRFFIGINPLRESHIVYNIRNASTDVTHIIDVSYKEFCNFTFLIVQDKGIELID